MKAPVSNWQRMLYSTALRAELQKVFLLALPLMLGELSSMLMGVAGTMMAGRLGPTALAASGVAGVVFVIAMLLVWGSVRMIPTPVAEAHELRDGAKVRTLIFGALLLGLILALAGAVLLSVGVANFGLLKQDPEVSALAVSYLHIIIFSMPVLVLFAVLVNLVDAFSYVRLTMLLSFGGLLLDVSLNWLLIFGNWGFPKMGIDAIAMNTGITHAVLCAVLILILWFNKELAYFRNARTNWSAVWEQTLRFLRYGIPSALQIMVEFAAFGLGTIIIGQIGKIEQAAHQVAINLISVTYVTIMGVSTAGMIRVGQALAYRSRIRIWLAGAASLVLALIIILLPTLLFLGMPGKIASWYSDDTEVVRMAISLLLFAGLFQLFDAAQATSISLLRAMSDVNVPTLISLLAFWVVGIPLGYYLAINQGWNAQGIWMGYLIALLIQAFLFVGRFFGLVRRFTP